MTVVASVVLSAAVLLLFATVALRVAPLARRSGKPGLRLFAAGAWVAALMHGVRITVLVVSLHHRAEPPAAWERTFALAFGAVLMAMLVGLFAQAVGLRRHRRATAIPPSPDRR